MTTIQILNNLCKSHLNNRKYLRLSQYVHTKIDTATPKQKEKAAKQKPNKKHAKEVDMYLSSNNRLLKIKNEIPERFFKRNRKTPDDLYLVDSKLASKIAHAIKPYILEKDKTIIETNAGFGYITKQLLNSGLQNCHIYESTAYFRNHILKLNQEYPGRLKLYNRDFFSIWNLAYQDRHDNGDRVKRMLSSVEIKDWENVPAMTIIGTLSSSNFIRHLHLSLIFQFGIMTYGRCELLVTVPPPLYLQLTCGSDIGYILYRASSVMFQIFCDHEILLKVPRKAFLPWDNSLNLKSTSKLKKLYVVDTESMYLTRIVFKKDLPVPLNKLQHLWYFVQNIMLSRKCKIIPALEKWIPGCGVRLLSNSKYSKSNIHPNINIFTEIGELSPTQILNLFKLFSSWPEYSESPFIASMETAMLKMESMQASDNPGEATEVPEESNESERVKITEVSEEYNESQTDGIDLR